MTNLNKDRDQVILEHILEQDTLINHANSHLGPLEKNSTKKNFIKKIEWDNTKKYKVALIMAPAWGVLFPPYNLAKITGLIRSNDYSTKVYDLNIESYHIIKNTLNEDYWRGEKYFLWTVKENFENEILPHLKKMFDETINEIVTANPKVIGFSAYNTNIFATQYLLTKLKEKIPNACFVVGGPEVVTGSSIFQMQFNYLFKGEAEESFLSLLENLPNQYENNKIIGTTDSKLKLENFPFPDYSDYDLSSYQHPDGVSIETSRGCIAQCSFCAETYFWKFRSNVPERVVDEIEYQANRYGVKRFWFVDSLVNGNLKVFEKIVDLIIDRKLDIKWNSYARCDGRMTKDFIRKIQESGCTCLSYGVESGSQKVLHDMRKKVEVWEIENNLKHGSEVGLFNHVNWMIGFPTEDRIDFLHSLQLLGNARKHINAISPGFGAGPSTSSHMETDWKTYKIVGENWLAEQTFLNAWYTEGYQNTILHRFIRIKFLHIWLEVLKNHADSKILNSQRYFNINDFYTFKVKSNWFFNKKCKEYCEYDGNIDLNKFNDNMGIAGEYFTLAYAMYKYFGSFELTVQFDHEKDLSTFGDWLTNDYTANFKIGVKNNGSFKVSLEHTFNHRSLNDLNKNIYEKESNYNDMSFSEKINISDNFKNWISDLKQTKETVHEQYRNEPKKVIPIKV